MNFKRNLFYFVFIAVQLLAICILLIGFFVKPIARDPNDCYESSGLLMVQIGCTIEVSIKLFILLLFLLLDRLTKQPESYGKPVSCFIAAGIIWIISISMVIFGTTLFKKMAFWLTVQGLSYLNEGLFNLYHIRTYPKQL